MTFLIKCDGCGKTLEAAPDNSCWPSNPTDDITGQKWYSRYDKDSNKTKHACSRSCMDGAPVWPI